MNDRDGQHDAHVQVLTAEVRALMVGSRQVTMSVYNQLDFVPYGQIEPFGRVNPRGVEGNDIYVVGKDGLTGSLVRARTPTLSEEFISKKERKAGIEQVFSEALEAVTAAGGSDELRERIEFAIRILATLERSRIVNDDWYKRLLIEAAERKGWYRPSTGWSINRALKEERERETGEVSVIAEIDRYRAAENEARKRCSSVRARWSDLPLIVLAGLR